MGVNIHCVTVLFDPTPSSRAVSRIEARKADSRFSTRRVRGMGIDGGFMVVGERMERSRNSKEPGGSERSGEIFPHTLGR